MTDQLGKNQKQLSKLNQYYKIITGKSLITNCVISKQMLYEICAEFDISRMGDLTKDALQQLVYQYRFKVLKRPIILDPVSFFYESNIRDLTHVLQAGFEIQVPQTQYSRLFTTFFSNNPDFNALIPLDFEARLEFEAMKIVKSTRRISRTSVQAILQNQMKIVHDLLPFFTSTRFASVVITSSIVNQVSSLSKQSQRDCVCNDFDTLIVCDDKTMLASERSLTQARLQQVVHAPYMGKVVGIALLDIGRCDVFCFPIIKPQKQSDRPGFQFITAFLRAVLLLKPTTDFDVIDFNTIFKLLQKEEVSFEKLNAVYEKDPILFQNVLIKNATALYQPPDQYKIETILKRVENDFDVPSTSISCVDSVTLQPLTDACRGSNCTHVQCLNFSTYCSNVGYSVLNDARCPLCKSPHAKVIIDILTQKLVNFVRGQNKGKDIRSIEVDNDFFKVINVVTVDDEESDWFGNSKVKEKVTITEQIFEISSSEEPQAKITQKKPVVKSTISLSDDD